MGRNTGKSHRKGAMKDRSQTFNQKTGCYIKRDTTTGKFISTKKTPFKGVSKDTNAKQSLKTTKKN